MPFSCFRNSGEPVFQNLRDGGVSGKLMGMQMEKVDYSIENQEKSKEIEEEEDDLRWFSKKKLKIFFPYFSAFVNIYRTKD